MNASWIQTSDGFSPNVDKGSYQIGSTLIDINLFDSTGESIEKFSESIRICISEPKGNLPVGSCLGFFNTTTSIWECQDRQLSPEGGTFCGETGKAPGSGRLLRLLTDSEDHLTSFALLLGALPTSSNGVEAKHFFQWMTLAFLLAAFVCVFIAVGLNEAYFRFRMIKKKRFLSHLETIKTAGASDASLNSDQIPGSSQAPMLSPF